MIEVNNIVIRPLEPDQSTLKDGLNSKLFLQYFNMEQLKFNISD